MCDPFHVRKFKCKMLRRYNILSNLMTHIHLSLLFFFRPIFSTTTLHLPTAKHLVRCVKDGLAVFGLLNRRGIVRVVKDGITIFWAEVDLSNRCGIVSVTSRWQHGCLFHLAVPSQMGRKEVFVCMLVASAGRITRIIVVYYGRHQSVRHSSCTSVLQSLCPFPVHTIRTPRRISANFISVNFQYF
jgi:hypothetical protein